MKVIKGSPLVSAQDGGRFGYRNIGVPISGFMDSSSAKLANAIVGNDVNKALLEIAGPGLKLRCQETAHIVFCGADAEIFINGNLVSRNQVIKVVESDEIAIGAFKNGNFLYMAIHGGFPENEILGSKSWFKHITPQHHLPKDYSWNLDAPFRSLDSKSRIKITNEFPRRMEVKVTCGPEYDVLNSESKQILFREDILLSTKISRMGFHLDNNPLHTDSSYSMHSSAVFPGTVQLLPSGKIIVLMKDAQTSGGYPRILQVNSDDLSRLAQLSPGGKVRFVLE